VLCLSVLVGVTAHLFNAMPDIDSDREMGLGGLAVSLGRRQSIALTVVLMALIAASLAWVVADVVASMGVRLRITCPTSADRASRRLRALRVACAGRGRALV
jgi:4-hydroxybenzoate polyprenyltransferase